MTGTYLEQHDPARGMARFYAVSFAPTLFGEWALVREWGRIGSSGTVRADWFGSGENVRMPDKALDAAQEPPRLQARGELDIR